mgnify:CR=1 FL=1
MKPPINQMLGEADFAIVSQDEIEKRLEWLIDAGWAYPFLHYYNQLLQRLDWTAYLRIRAYWNKGE